MARGRHLAPKRGRRRATIVVTAVVLAMALATPAFATGPNDAINQNLDSNGAFERTGAAGVTNGQVCFRAGPAGAILTPGDGGANADATDVVVVRSGACGSDEITQRIVTPGISNG